MKPRMPVLFALGALLAITLTGCHRSLAKRQSWVVIADCSASIKPSSRKLMIQEISDLARTLHRGDTLTIIPVMSDELTQVQGRILRFQVPAKRQPFDTDKRTFQEKVHTALAALEREILSNPGSKSDILGAEAVAEQVLAQYAGPTTSEHLLILSDLVEDDATINFATAPEMRSTAMAEQYARKRAKEAGPDLVHQVPVETKLLGSRDLAGLGNVRRVTVPVFWRVFLTCRGFQNIGFGDYGVSRTEYRIDGLPELVREDVRTHPKRRAKCDNTANFDRLSDSICSGSLTARCGSITLQTVALD